MFNLEERKLKTTFEEVASEMYGGDATKFFTWSEEYGGEYERLDVNAAFRAFLEGYRLGRECQRMIDAADADVTREREAQEVYAKK